MAPDYTVAFAVVPVHDSAAQSVPEDASGGALVPSALVLVGCRKIPSDASYVDALEIAKGRYPQVPWILVERHEGEYPSVIDYRDFYAKVTSIKPKPRFGLGLGQGPRYWAMNLHPVEGLGGGDVLVVERSFVETPMSQIELKSHGRMDYRFVGFSESLDELLGGA